jgi:hypothetical protein
MFDKVFASFSFLIRKISKKKKKHVDWQPQFRIWHVPWLV